MRRRNLTGQRFGTVVVLDDPATPGGRTVPCRCDCGRTVELYRDGLTTGRTTTCGDRPAHRRTIAGQRFGTVVVLDDPTTPGGRTVPCRCDCGRTVELYRDGLTTGRTTTCGDRWEHHRQPVVTYADAHWRVKRERGPARAHTCVDCGRPADHWTYDHTDPAELVEPRYFGPASYSLDVERYEPRCVSCHARVDRAWRAGRVLRAPTVQPVQPALFDVEPTRTAGMSSGGRAGADEPPPAG